jgi:hypothetical protein
MQTPTLDQQLDRLHPEFRTVANPSRKEVIAVNIMVNSDRIHHEWIKAEPNLTEISRLTKYNKELREELNLLNAKEN